MASYDNPMKFSRICPNLFRDVMETMEDEQGPLMYKKRCAHICAILFC